MTAGRIISLSLFTLGMILMVLNLTGIFKSLRDEELYREITPYKDDITLRYEEACKLWDRGEHELEQDFAARATMLVNHSMAHYWRDEGIRKYHLRVPLWENYILTFRQWFTGHRKYEFRNYQKAIERGVGLCSQPCIALKYLLNANGISADLWDLQQHIVVGVTFRDGTGYTLDPDYGYIIPVAIDGLLHRPDLVREAYKNQDAIYASHVTEHKHTEDIVRMYTQAGNHIYQMKKPFEDFSYLAKWVLPMLMVLPYLLTLLKKKQT